MVIAAGLSVGIEVTQYIFALGYSDVDDVLFNTAGAAMGACAMLRLDHERQTKLLWRLGFLAAALLVIVVCGLVTGIIG
ncbi:VanZ family protein [Corynebacterium phoceense]|uniref:VanZ family protein n=1 Tax=Corynebacterium phoceense TaxID=1686286 RepID=UPI000839C760|nr:VanZ family protein [Corynebacterium phoceense]